MNDDDLDTAAAVQQYLGAETRTVARSALSGAAGTSGDLEAELRAASARTGVPISSARAQPDVVKRRAAVGEVMDTVERFPTTLMFLADEGNARLAHDDTDTLTGIERTIGGIAAWAMGADGRGGLPGDVGAGVFRASRGAAGVFQAGAETVAPLLDLLAPGTPGIDVAGWFARQGATAERKARDLAGTPEGIVAGGVSSGVQSLVGNLLMLPMAFLPGGQPAALAGMSSQAGGTSYQKAREKGVSSPAALAYGASDAVIEFATEKIPVGRLFGDLKAGTPLFTTLWRQAAAEVPGEQVATVLQDLNEWAVLNPDKPFSSYLAERPSAAAQTLIATLVGVGGNVAVMRTVQNALDVAQGVDRGADLLQDLMAQAGASKLRERDPQKFADLVQQAAADSAAPAEVFIDVKALDDALAQSGITPEQLTAALPSLGAQLEDAAATGGDVVIPVGEFAAGIAGSPLEAVLMQHVRTSPEALSQAEAKAAASEKQLRTIADQVYGQREAEQADTTSRDVVRQTVLDELNKAGRFTADVNSAYAEMTAQFFATQADRMGTTAEELFAKYPLKVRSAGSYGDALQQRQPAPVESTEPPTTVKQDKPAAPSRETVQLRKRKAVLERLLECING